MFNVLTHPMMLPITLPVAAGILCLILPRVLEKACFAISLIVSAITVVVVWPLFKAGSGVYDYGRFLSLRIDQLSSFVLLATTVFGFLIALFSIGYMKGKARLKEFNAYLLWTVGISCGAVLANDLLLLLAFWGFLGLTLYLMINLGGPDASAAAKKSFVVIGASDSILLLGVAIVWMLSGTTRMDGAPLALQGTLRHVAYLALAVAAFAKAGAMPFHSWVPDCGEKAPAAVTAFLPASLDKLLGIYLLARTSLHLFQMNAPMNVMLQVVGAGTVILAVMMALVQHDMKRLLSYHAVSQVGYMVLGIGTANPVGIAGGLFHMLNHAMYKSCLFLCAGSVEKQAGSSDLDQLGGLAKVMPVTFVACVVAAMSISGIPPLNGFASKWMVYQGVIESGRNGGGLWIVWLVAAMLGSALTLASFVKVLHAAFLRKPAPTVAERSPREVNFTMWIPMMVLALACIIFGVLAYRLPLQHLIVPAIGQPVAFLGTWWAGPATAMLVVGFVLGLIIYLITTARKARECITYIGGEIIQDAYVSGVPYAGDRDVEVTGVDFYRTVQDFGLLRGIYRMAERKFFDLYEVGAKIIFGVSKVFQLFHTGVLTTYVVWYILGLVILLFVIKS